MGTVKNQEITAQKSNETKKKSSEFKSKHLKTQKIMRTPKKSEFFKIEEIAKKWKERGQKTRKKWAQ